MNDRLLDAAEVADGLNVSVSGVRESDAVGCDAIREVGRYVRFEAEAVDELIRPISTRGSP